MLIGKLLLTNLIMEQEAHSTVCSNTQKQISNHIASGSWQEPVSEVAGRGEPEGAPPKVGHSHGAQDSV